MSVFYQRQGNVPPVIATKVTKGEVTFLLSDLSGPGLKLHTMQRSEFDRHFAPSKDDPFVIANILKEHAKTLGGTEEAIEAMSQISPMNEGMKNMARTAAKAAEAAPAPKGRGAKAAPAVETPVKAGKGAKAAAPEVKEPKAPRAPKEVKEKRPSVSSRICELIMEGKKSDDEIFATVQKELGIDDSKRGYISWNRNNLKKMGKNPPGPIGGAKTKTSTKAEPEPAPTPAKRGKKA